MKKCSFTNVRNVGVKGEIAIAIEIAIKPRFLTDDEESREQPSSVLGYYSCGF